MIHDRLEFVMPATSAVAFDAFHYHQWRMRWDTLVAKTKIGAGADSPSVGAVSSNDGRGFLRPLSMRTKFVSYKRPRIAAAVMIGTSFPFSKWAASIQHRDLSPQESLLIYTYTFATGPKLLQVLLEPIVARIFARQTHARFKRMQKFIQQHRGEIEQWQQDNGLREKSAATKSGQS